ncbi:MAG: hypothetical protein A3F73_06490 [Gallionellales bacterium RIFCSPLOWO2_12_FULL_59_22]|nr:MAG: hypothetical protein A3H99_11375 [Gallionellales bacterium RIFCSPLOWO2_02_FULL_59_110]OGT02428.1 MAG: hypothetical protein A2Z65_08720 [Gallionellales bacterium RIFCSPLOWO2_02_58_13]OGT13447.1 MAG: hypothetical protein A3F73_06490 [Gallionellales bacterium RIFCSPLOWO2_12_FULL_59_22]
MKFKFSSIETRLIGVMLLLTVLPVIAVAWIAGSMTFSYIRSDRIHDVGQVANMKHTQLVLVLARANDRALSFLSGLIIQCRGNAARLDHVCADGKIRQYLGVEGAIGAMLRGGGSESLAVGTPVVRDGEKIAFQAGQLAQFSGTGPGNNRSYFISVAEKSTGFRLEITYPSSMLDPVFDAPAVLGKSGETFLADGEGYFVTKPRYPSTQGHSHPISARPMQSCLSAQNREVLDQDYRDVAIIHGFRFIPEFGAACIMAHVDQKEAFAPLESLRQRLLILMAIFCITLVVVIASVARNIVRPVTKLTDVARAIATGDYTVQAEAKGKDEIAELAASFNFMTSRLFEQSAHLEDMVRERTKKLEQAQQETAALLRRNQSLMQNSMDGIAIMDAQGNLVEANDAFRSKLGYTRQEMAGLNVTAWEMQWSAEESRVRFKELIGKSATYETLYRRKDGPPVNVEVSASGVEIDGHQYVFASIRDITVRKRDEERIRASEALLRQAQSLASIGSWRINVPRNELVWSAETYRIFDIPADAPLTYESFLVNVHPDDKGLVDSAWKAALKGAPYQIQHRIVVHGETRWVEERAELDFDEQGNLSSGMGSVQDITERKRAEAQIAESMASLRAVNQSLDEFTYIAAHDLKEPLRGIHNYTSFLKEDYGERLDGEAQQYIGSIQRLAERLSALIDRLLAYSRLGSTELARSPVDVDAAVDAVAKDLSSLWRDRAQGGMGVELRRNGPLGAVQGDATRIGEVFQNLLANAAKYNDKPLKWIEIGCDRSGANPVFYVRDNGIGIQPHHQASVFRIFKRLHEQNKYGGGTGAGLTITKKIIELHGGRIWLESTPGEGTTFYFTLSEDAT